MRVWSLLGVAFWMHSLKQVCYLVKVGERNILEREREREREQKKKNKKGTPTKHSPEADADFEDILTASSTHQSSDVASIASSTTSSSTQVAFVQHVGHVRLLELLTSILKRYTGILDIQRHALSSLEHLCALQAFEAKVFHNKKII